ncbi:MAG: hypothetical protein N4A74_19110 [Carboxylicivirga sp.]|jgi:hypothetical protein|nr:hypothetical protein [Carboxylicivirga sp.]
MKVDLKKNPKTLTILIILVIAIWTLIIIKVINPQMTPNQLKKKADDTNMTTKDTIVPVKYSLILNYADPFMSSIDHTRIRHENIDNEVADVTKHIEDRNQNGIQSGQKNNLQIFYRGFICNSTKREKIGVLIIDQKSCLLKEQQKYDDIEICKLFADSIIIKYQNELLVIHQSDNKE